MKKRLLPLFTLLLTACLMAKANPVDVQQARKIGAKYLQRSTEAKVASEQELTLAATYRTEDGTAAFYIFNGPSSFVIVAADDCATPILGQSATNQFNVDDHAPALEGYLQGFVEQIQYGIESRLSALDTVAHQWEIVRATGLVRDDRATASAVAPLLTTTWGQGSTGYKYNIFCPTDSRGPNGHAITGCVATAMGQIMRYWRYPASGNGSHGYYPPEYPSQYQYVNFGNAVYDWDNMPDELTTSSTNAQNNAVATLLWHCGVSVDMDYYYDDSGAVTADAADALKDYFNYSSGLHYDNRSDFSDDQWLDKLKADLNKGRPVLYRGRKPDDSAGHAFVCDGYNADDALHFNWGWYGNYQNDYYALDALTPGNHNYSGYNAAIFGIYPKCEEETYVHALPYHEDFEAGETEFFCFSKHDWLNLSQLFKSKWTTYASNGTVNPPSGSLCAKRPYNTNDSNDWLIMSPVFLQPGRDASTLTFKTYEGFAYDYTFEGVYVSTTGTSTSDFTQVWTQNNPSASWKTVSINLNAYRGQIIYIAFVYTGADGHNWYIDDVNIEQSWSPCGGNASLPFNATFDTSISSCWYIIDSDMSGGERCWKWNESSQSAYHPYGQQDKPQEGWLISRRLFLQPGRDITTLTFRSGSTSDGTGKKNTIWLALDKPVGELTPSDFTVQVWEDPDYSSTWTTYTVNLSAYQGHTINIGFKYEGTYAHSWYIDDVVVTESWQPCGSTSLPFEDQFNSSIGGCWYIIDSDMSGGERCWQWKESSQSAYHPRGQQDKPQVGWLISRRLFLQPGRDATTLTFKSGSTSDGTGKKNTIWLALDKPVGELTPSDFTVKVWEDPYYSSTWTTYTVDLSAYQGHNINIGFKYEGTCAHNWFIDNVNVTESWALCSYATTPYSESFDSSLNGCWYIIDSDKSGEERCWKYDASDNCAVHPWGQPDTPQVGWLFSKKVWLSSNYSYNLSFYAKTYSDGDGRRNSVWIAVDKTGTPNPSDYTEIWVDPSYNTSWTNYNIDLSEYAGHYVNIAFKYEGTFAHRWSIDDFSITKICNITASANPSAGGSVTGGGTYNEGTTCTLTATANTGYHFVNWTKNGTQVSTNSTYSFTVTGDGTYVANFALNSYSITASASPAAGGTVSGAGTYNYGQSCTLTATPNSGYDFINWTKNGSVVSTNAAYTFTVTEAGAYVANFSQNNYTISASADPAAGGTVSGAGTYNYGQSCTLTATPNAGYTFVNWKKNGEVVSTNATYTFTVTASGAYEASFSQNNYTITASADPAVGGTVSGGGNFTYGQSCTLTATPNSSYIFVNWTLSSSVVSNDAAYTFTVTESGNYVANFSQSSYSITASADPAAGGTVSGAGNYIHGQNCTLTATPNAGYTFVNWTKNGVEVSTNASYNFLVTASGAYVAHFSQNSYTITASADPAAGGTVSGAGNFTYGQSCTLTATPNTGYTFVNWTLSSSVVSNDAAYTFTVTESGNYVAHFSQNSYTITASADPAAGGTVSGAGNYTYGQSCTLTATPNTGYTFVNWTKNGVEVSTNASCTFTVTASGAYVAHFAVVGGDITQSSHFNNGWTWWSTCIEQPESNGLTQLENGLGDNGLIIKKQTASVTNVGGDWYGTLYALDNASSYRIKTNAEVDVDITGPAVVTASHPVTLLPNWTWIGYPCAGAMSIDEAMSGITPTDMDVLKTQSGSATYMFGGWYGALGTLTPGMGLMYKSNSSGNITLTFPSGGAKGELKPNLTAEHNHWQPNLSAYPDNMTVIAVVELDDEPKVPEPVEGPTQELGENYELAAFANGECRGSVRLLYVEPLNRYVAFLTVAGDEIAELRFGLYNTETGEEYHNAEETLTYESNAVVGSLDAPYVIRFRSNTGLDDLNNRIQVFPNPVGKGQTFNIGMTDAEIGEVEIAIINALGVVVETRRATSLQHDTVKAPNVPGVYTLRITVEGMGTCYRKLVVE